ncbi:hypothetical protein BN131_3337 [Cronobacter malonaticus 681]|nr:hypothetical protein BN131_3337 [Cronobacter malonaticus 681]
MAHIVTAKAGIHQHQPVMVGFNQQAVADEMRVQPFTEAIVQRAAQRTHTTAVEMVYSHNLSFVAQCSKFNKGFEV